MRKAIDNLLLYDVEFRGCAEQFAAETNGNSETYAVNSMKDLEKAIDSFSNVKFLEIMLHGKPGMIDFADGGSMLGSYFGKMVNGKPFVQNDLRILFNSCNIGEGERGDKFMDELGKSLLMGKGGTIGATTVKNIVLLPESGFATGVFMKPLSFGRLKVVRYDTAGNRTVSRTVDRHGIIR
ncbi:MAG: hypothetical protein R2681_02595 [Pyrinomonadaceae bacterium]